MSFFILEDPDGNRCLIDPITRALLVELSAAPGILIGDVSVIEADPYTTPTHTAVNVTTVTGVVLAANANRRYALLVNDSDTVIYIMLGAAAVANQGIRINANGGNYEMSLMLGNLYTGAINGIHAGVGDKALLMLEGV